MITTSSTKRALKLESIKAGISNCCINIRVKRAGHKSELKCQPAGRGCQTVKWPLATAPIFRSLWMCGKMFFH